MTHQCIQKKFEAMRLAFKGTSEPVKFSHRMFRGYWTIPGEQCEFRIIAIEPRSTWAIEVRAMLNSGNNFKYLLTPEMGILFIQTLICEKFESIGKRMDPEWLIPAIIRKNDFLRMYDITNK